MHIDEHTKKMQKIYCRTVLAEHGELTKDLYEKINAGDEVTMRKVYLEQQQRIRDRAAKIQNPADKELTLSQVESIQEVLDSLSDILNA